MHPNAALLTRFYEAFARKDADTMATCYAPDATFSDPVFPSLRGPEVTGMWRMLAGALEGSVTFSGVEADDREGRAHWEAHYVFTLTKRNVHNIIEARFTFADGKIATHVDQFDFWRWSRQALGATGLLLGWSPLVKNAVRKQAGGRLQKFIATGGARP